MQYDITENLTRVLVVSAQLGTAIVMMPGINIVNAVVANLSAHLLCQFLSNAVDTSYRRDDPEFITCAYLSVLTQASLKCTVYMRNIFCLIVNMIILIGDNPFKVCLEIVFVNPCPCTHILLGMTDGITVLDDVCSLLHICYQ